MSVNGSGTVIPTRSGVMRQKQPDQYVLRLKAVAGDLTVKQLERIARVAGRYAKGEVHLSTRQGIEIHHVHSDNLEIALKELQEAGVELGASGRRVRVIVACPGEQTCKWGVFDTRRIAGKLDSNYFNQDTPSKFKMAVAGCSNNCTKANENDIGIRGAIEPAWEAQDCCDCGLCIAKCPVAAIGRHEKEDGHYRYEIDLDTCINCSICTAHCPGEAWIVSRKGYNLFIGGTMGKIPRFATPLKKMVESEEELFRLIESSIAVYRKYAQNIERFGHMIDRIGIERVKEEILDASVAKNRKRSRANGKPRKTAVAKAVENV
ncbi:MAG: 4Fe-4S dicluster domain-containing protein [Chlorobiaceae bacterium]|nr:4Fe-4S dicluster domain-containing protein [Chlorobiaceae bacterium]